MLRIAILCTGFMEWGGGIDLLRAITTALVIQGQKKPIKLYLMVPEPSLADHVKRQLRMIRFCLKKLMDFRLKPYYSEVLRKEPLFASFKYLLNDVEIFYYKNGENGLKKALLAIQADVALPSIYPLARNFPIPWIGYIADFQHRYYPQFFNKKTCNLRDKEFSTILASTSLVIVNSLEVRKDIQKFYPNNTCSVVSLPFTPAPERIWMADDNSEVITKYNLPDRFFLISNQFWAHKGHRTAFNAFALLKQKVALEKIAIVCTGKEYDPRFPNYVHSLKDEIQELGISKDIYFLGHIPKLDQIQLMQRSVAVLQPTMFEGGPGGGAVFDAVALGIPAIVSDIPINLEIKGEDITFFSSGSAEDMAKKMEAVSQRSQRNLNNREELYNRGQARLEILGEELLKAIAQIIKVADHV